MAKKNKSGSDNRQKCRYIMQYVRDGWGTGRHEFTMQAYWSSPWGYEQFWQGILSQSVLLSALFEIICHHVRSKRKILTKINLLFVLHTSIKYHLLYLSLHMNREKNNIDEKHSFFKKMDHSCSKLLTSGVNICRVFHKAIFFPSLFICSWKFLHTYEKLYSYVCINLLIHSNDYCFLKRFVNQKNDFLTFVMSVMKLYYMLTLIQWNLKLRFC